MTRGRKPGRPRKTVIDSEYHYPETPGGMKIITVSLSYPILEDIDILRVNKVFPSRSEAIRTLILLGLPELEKRQQTLLNMRAIRIINHDKSSKEVFIPMEDGTYTNRKVIRRMDYNER